jgi:hypothetical protein
MALQSSGQIKMSEINTELSRTSNVEISLSDASDGTLATLNTNNAAADRPDGTAPHAMSEWFSYNHTALPPSQPSTKFWKYNGANDRLVWRDSSPSISGTSQDMSFSFWFRIDRTSKDNLLFFDLYPQGTSSNANRFFLNYSANLNRFVARYRSSSSNFDRQWGLHDTGNSSATGVTNSGTGLCTAQRGNVNSDNFAHIVVTYDASQTTGASAFKCYWNATELTKTATSNNGSRSAFNFTEITWGNDYNSGTGDASGYDEMRIYSKVLSSSEITSIYNSGSPEFSSSDGVTSSLIFEDRAEASTPVDSQGEWTRYISSGTLTNL